MVKWFLECPALADLIRGRGYVIASSAGPTGTCMTCGTSQVSSEHRARFCTAPTSRAHHLRDAGQVLDKATLLYPIKTFMGLPYLTCFSDIGSFLSVRVLSRYEFGRNIS